MTRKSPESMRLWPIVFAWLGAAQFALAATIDVPPVTIKPSAPHNTSTPITLQPRDTATFTVTVESSEQIGDKTYTLIGTTIEITPKGQASIWTGGPVFSLVNASPTEISTTAEVTCNWSTATSTGGGAGGAGGGTGGAATDTIGGHASLTANLKIAHISWTIPTMQELADNIRTLTWDVQLLDQNNELANVTPTFNISAPNLNPSANWTISPASGAGPRLNGTVKADDGSRGSLKVSYTYFGQSKSDSSELLTFVGMDKLQYKFPPGVIWKNAPAQIYVVKGTSVDFKAIKKPSDATWPEGKPVWTGISGSGDQASQTFNTPGITTVKAECGTEKQTDVTAFELVVKSVDFSGTGNCTMKKQDADTWENDTFESGGDKFIVYPEWQDNDLDGTADVDEPVCYKKNTAPLMNVILSLKQQLGQSVSAILRVKEDDTEQATRNITLTGTTITVNDLTWNNNLPNYVDNWTHTLTWEISLDSGFTYTTIGTTAHRFFVIYGTPEGSDFTAKRVNWCTDLAMGCATKAEIGDAIGPDATGGDRFGDKSIFGDPHGLNTAWKVMDLQGTLGGDCGTLSTLMKLELDLLGATGAEVRFVYPRNASWTGLSQPSPPEKSYIEVDASGNKLQFYFAYGSGEGPNDYEGCCAFESKWWEGGNGRAVNSAYAVLIDVCTTDNAFNQDGVENSHQAWINNIYTAVDTPTGTP